MPSNAPKIGDLVRLDNLAEDYPPSLKIEFQNAVGVVTECVGIRCKVDWTNGATTRPMRTVLEIINAAR